MASTYIFDTSEEGERDRLRAHSLMWDPVSRRRLAGTGLTEGWRCLEIGAGTGTVTRWLAGEAGATGHVVATDLELRWLRELDAPNVQVMRHDVTTDPLGESVYDLIYGRLVLVHMPDPRATLDKLLRALVPGGRLLLEEYDLATLPFSDPPDALWQKVAAAPAEVIGSTGGDPRIGTRLTGLLYDAGFVDVDTEAVALPRRMPEARGWQAQFVQLRGLLIDNGLVSPEEVDEVIAGFEDKSRDLILYGPTLISASGRRP